MNWLRRFWFQDTPDEMQRKMLCGIRSNRYMPRSATAKVIARIGDAYLSHFPRSFRELGWTANVPPNSSLTWYKGHHIWTEIQGEYDDEQLGRYCVHTEGR